MRFSTTGALAALFSTSLVNAALPTISANGQYFFTSDGDRWFIKGIAYQLAPADPLLNTAQCQRDATLMKTLGANAIRVYHVTSPGDHSGCMNAFADAGIYLFVDLDTFTTYINAENTVLNPTWTTAQQNSFQAVMDDFQQYDNTAGFFIGNEVVNDPTFSEATAYIKAATRDMKAYRDSKGYRNIPIGYSHADISAMRPMFQNYLACGDTSDSIEFFGLNSYEWCGGNTFQGSGYQTLTQEIMNFSIPVFMSETGCNNPPPRTFEDQTAMFSSEMTPYWSGAIIYEWIQEVNHYGLITYGDDTDASVTNTVESLVTRSGTPTPITPDFANLMAAWATATPSGVSSAAYTPSNSAPSCPSYTASSWLIAGDVPLPTLNEAYNTAVQYSITAGHLEGQAAATTTSSAMTSGGMSGSKSGMTAGPATASATTSGAAASQTGAAGRAYSSGDQSLVGMGLGLVGVLLGAIVWL